MAASGCTASAISCCKWLSRVEHQDAREGLAISRSSPLRPTRTVPPFLPFRFARTPVRRRHFTVAARDSNPQQQQELNVSVLRFTFGIPGLDESYLPRYIGIAFGTLIVVNHVFSASPATPAQLRTEALGIFLAALSTALPYLARFLEGANAVDRAPLPEENRQIFLMSSNISDTQKEDLAWVSYVLLRNTNSMSVMIAVNDVLCVRGYWSTSEDKDASRDHLLKWFNNQIQQTGFFDLKDTLYFPRSPGRNKFEEEYIVHPNNQAPLIMMTQLIDQFKTTDSELEILLPKGTFSVLVQPVIRTFDPIADFSMKNEGFVLLASNVRYAYAEKDRGWIRAISNKFLHMNGVKITKDLQHLNE